MEERELRMEGKRVDDGWSRKEGKDRYVEGNRQKVESSRWKDEEKKS